MTSTDTLAADHELDARGMNCPLPILKTRQVIKAMQPGEVLRMVSTDTGSVNDIAAFCRQTGHQLVASNEQDREFIFFIRKC
jgi:tRNA 2-thiouridine synthesizing protein A